MGSGIRGSGIRGSGIRDRISEGWISGGRVSGGRVSQAHRRVSNAHRQLRFCFVFLAATLPRFAFPPCVSSLVFHFLRLSMFLSVVSVFLSFVSVHLLCQSMYIRFLSYARVEASGGGVLSKCEVQFFCECTFVGVQSEVCVGRRACLRGPPSEDFWACGCAADFEVATAGYDFEEESSRLNFLAFQFLVCV